jgi:hypothetical protein
MGMESCCVFGIYIKCCGRARYAVFDRLVCRDGFFGFTGISLRIVRIDSIIGWGAISASTTNLDFLTHRVRNRKKSEKSLVQMLLFSATPERKLDL